MQLCARMLLGIVLSSLAAGQDDIQQQEATARALSIPELRAADLPAWRAHLRPAADELGWRTIPWLSTFTAGVLAADAAEKPLLFWAMNGHPLGCT
jgi:hypothetical protein